jgi:hypothetical protein
LILCGKLAVMQAPLFDGVPRQHSIDRLAADGGQFGLLHLIKFVQLAS